MHPRVHKKEVDYENCLRNQNEEKLGSILKTKLHEPNTKKFKVILEDSSVEWLTIHNPENQHVTDYFEGLVEIEEFTVKDTKWIQPFTTD